MDISALTKQEFTAWVPFDDGAEVLIRYVPRDVLVDIGRRAVVVKLDPKTRKETREYDPIAADCMIAAAAVVDWKGFEVDGQDFPCTPENLETLVRKWGAFSRFVSESCVSVGILAASEAAETEKN